MAQFSFLHLLFLVVTMTTIAVDVVGAYKSGNGGATDSDSDADSEAAATTVFHSPLDGRWSSKHFTQEEKAALGWFPPPGEVWPDDPPELLASKQQAAGGSGTMSIIDTAKEADLVTGALEEEHEEINQKIEQEEEMEHQDSTNGDDNGGGNETTNANDIEPYATAPPFLKRGTFLRYDPSTWEQEWMVGIEEWQESKAALCRYLLHGKHQTARVHDFLDLLCSARLDGKLNNWCYYHDHNHWMWYNSANRDIFEIYIDITPMLLEGIDPPPVNQIFYDADSSKWNAVASKMWYTDPDSGKEYFEFIEPLVAQLKFPLAECLDRPPKPLLSELASFVLPPSVIPGSRTLLYDVGSRDWSQMEYLVEEWEARGATFSDIVTYSTSQDEVNDPFLQTVPEQHQSHIYRQYFLLANQPVEDDRVVFIPSKIQQEATEDDYVVLKLDRAPAKLKESIVQYILEHVDEVHVDELIWEINASGNHVMEDWISTHREFNEISSLSLKDAYQILSQLREKGIRAHSWI